MDDRIPIVHSVDHLLKCADESLDADNARFLIQEARIKSLQDQFEALTSRYEKLSRNCCGITG